MFSLVFDDHSLVKVICNNMHIEANNLVQHRTPRKRLLWMVLKIQLNIVTKKLKESDVWVFSFCPCWLPHIGWRGLYEFWSEQIFGFQIERPRGGDPEWSGGRRGGGWGWRNPASSGVVWCMTELTGKWGWSSWGWQQPTPPSFHQRSVSSCHHTNSHNSSSSWVTYTKPWFFMCMCEWWLTGVWVVQYAIWDRDVLVGRKHKLY